MIGRRPNSQYEDRDQAIAGGNGNQSISSIGDEHLQTIEGAMSKLKEMHGSDGWKRVLHQKHGVDVWIKKDVVDIQGMRTKVPLFKGCVGLHGSWRRNVLT